MTSGVASAQVLSPYEYLRVDPLEHRHESYALSSEQRDAAAMFRRSLQDRMAPPGSDLELPRTDPASWATLGALDLLRLGIDVHHDGHGGNLGDLVLLMEEFGRFLLPAAFIRATVAARILSTALTMCENTAARDVLDRALGGELLLDLRTEASQGAAPDDVVPTPVLRVSSDRVGLATASQHHDEAESPPLLTGPAAAALARRARQEEHLLMAAALLGSARRATELAVDFAISRQTRGVSIGSLQGISHPLATCSVLQEAGRNLVRRAAWYLDHEPEAHPELVPAALVHVGDTALRSVEVAVHTHGGAGVCLESEVSQHFLWVQRTVGSTSRRAELIAEIGDWLARTSAQALGGRDGLQSV